MRALWQGGGKYFLDISLKGDFSESRTEQITSDGAEITFHDVTEGAKIHAEGSIYEEIDGKKIIFYTGESETITISEGENYLSLVLKKVPSFSDENSENTNDNGNSTDTTAVTFTVVFDANGGTGEMAAQVFTAGVSQSLSENTFTAPEGFKFAGWALSADEENAAYSDGADGSGLADTDGATVTLYAVWVEKDSHIISYELNGGTNSSENPSSFTETESVTLSEPTRSGYSFAGWYTASTFSGDSITGWSAGEKTDDITLYAKWEVGTKDAPSEVGDIVFSNGRAVPYSSVLELDDEAKSAAIAVIFYVGTDCNDSDETAARTLGIGLKQDKTGNLVWCTDSANAYSKNITTIKCTSTTSGDKNGSDNLSAIGTFLSENSSTDDTGTAANYPAFYFAKNYASQSGSNVSGTTYADGWYLPSIVELAKLYVSREDVSNALSACGGDTLESSKYWSSSQHETTQNAWQYDFSAGKGTTVSKNPTSGYIQNTCAIREF